MPSTRQGSLLWCRLAGIDVFVHGSWFVVAAFEISRRGSRYPSLVWNVAEYLMLFLVVTLHEFGHALACRQVGGTANKIVVVASWRRSLPRSAASPSSHTVEHRRGPARQPRAAGSEQL
jgi:Zn-dependent protease